MNLTTARALTSLTASAETIKALVVHADTQTKDRVVTLRTGRYAGRTGIISGVIPDRSRGLLYLIMVHRKNSRDVLNSDGASRAYRPLSDFEMGEQ